MSGVPQLKSGDMTSRTPPPTPTPKCGLCDCPVLGMVTTCAVCGHGGHLKCMLEWFQDEVMCPAGCGCVCVSHCAPEVDTPALEAHSGEKVPDKSERDEAVLAAYSMLAELDSPSPPAWYYVGEGDANLPPWFRQPQTQLDRVDSGSMQSSDGYPSELSLVDELWTGPVLRGWLETDVHLDQDW